MSLKKVLPSHFHAWLVDPRPFKNPLSSSGHAYKAIIRPRKPILHMDFDREVGVIVHLQPFPEKIRKYDPS